LFSVPKKLGERIIKEVVESQDEHVYVYSRHVKQADRQSMVAS